MDALMLRRELLTESVTGRCFCCGDRFSADFNWVKAYDHDGDDRGPVCEVCATVRGGAARADA